MRKEVAPEIEAKGLQSVELLGHVSPSEVVTLMHGARSLVVPSVWYEGFPRTIAEPFACGQPVVASRLGSMAEVIADGENGLRITPGDASELAEQVERAWTRPAEMEAMSRTARLEYEAKYTAGRNYEHRLSIYQGASA
jgi:glycosyltransferase involved in cell wall biosynthesis